MTNSNPLTQPIYWLVFSFILFSIELNSQVCSATATTIQVTNTNDDGIGSLRGAITCANAVQGPNTIVFNLPPTGSHVFFVGSTTGQPLPTLFDGGTIIDGATQPGFTGEPLIILDGINSNWTGPYDAILIKGHQCEIYGLTVRNFIDDGIDVDGAEDVIIGAPGKGNVIYNNGIFQDIFPGFSGNWNGCGIVVQNGAGNCTIQSNIIGTDYSQTIVAGNEWCGIIIASFSNNANVGGTLPGTGNIIANNIEGVYVSGTYNVSIHQNSMFCNFNGGITFTNNSNFLKQPPIISIAQVDYLGGSGASGDIVEVFLNDKLTCLDHPCQGKTYIGSATVIGGQWILANPFANGIVLQSGQQVTATATAPDGSTSTFALCRTVLDPATCGESNGDIWVTNTNDDGLGSLRSAIDCANYTPGPSQIKFNIPDSTIRHRIYVGSTTGQALPALLDDYTIIDATTQPGYGVSDFEPQIVLDGSQNNWNQPINAIWIRDDYCEVYGLEIVYFPDDGIDVTAANYAIIGAPNKGNVIYNNGDEIDFFPGAPNTGPWNGCAVVMKQGASFCLVQGNILGTNYSRDTTAGNEACGVIVQNNCVGNLIGGSGVGEANVIAYHEIGVRIQSFSQSCQIQQNSIYCNYEGIVLNGNANQFVQAPWISTVSMTTMAGTGIAGHTIEVFVSDTTNCPDVGCQGKYFLGETIVAADGTWTLNAPFDNNAQVYGGAMITATATDTTSNTSIFSNCVTMVISCNTVVMNFTNVEQPSCFLNNGTFEVIPNGGIPPYNFDFGNGPTSNNIMSNLSGGTYVVTLTDNNNCVLIDSITLTPISPPQIGVTSVMNETCGSQNGEIEVNVTNGIPPYTYNIGNGPQSSPVFSNLMGAVYSILVIDGSGCSDAVTIVLQNSAIPSIDITNLVNENCEMSDGTFTVVPTGGTPPFTYNIGNGDVSNPIFTGLTDGAYNVMVTDSLGCTQTTTAFVLNAPPILSNIISSQDAICDQSNGSFQVGVSVGIGPFTYDIGNGPVSSNTFTNLSSGNYQVTITNGPGCTTVNSVTIGTDGNPPNFFITNIVDENCGQADGAFDIAIGNGTGTYTYDIGNGPTTNSQFSGLSSGVYSITVTETNGCSATQNFTLNGNSISLNLDGFNHVTCGSQNGSISLSATGGTMPYEFNIGFGNSPSGFFPNLLGGIYNITLTDAEGCTDNVVVILDDPGVPSFSMINVIPENCGNTDGSFEISVNGGTPPFTYNDGSGQTTNPVYSNLNSGAYNIVVTDNNGCSASQVFTLNENIVGLNIANFTNASCGQNDGSITVTTTGGTAPYNFDIGNGATTNSVFSNLAGGNYNITLTDNNGCVAVQSQTIQSSNGPSFSFSNIAPETCGQLDGSFTVNGNGGQIPYTFDIGNGPSFGNVFSNLSEGTYQVTLTDDNQCTSVQPITIGGSTGPTLIIGDVFHESCGGANGAISVVAIGGVPTYEYDFGNGPTNSNSIMNASAGNYTVSVTDINGCTSQVNAVILNLGDAPNANYTYSNNLLTINFSEMFANGDTYAWNFGDGNTSTQSSPSHTYSTNGNYQVCLTVTNGCGSDTNCEIVAVSEPENVVFNISQANGDVGDTVYLSMIVEDFTNIVSFQQSIHIVDPTVAEFVGVNNFNLPNLNNSSFSISNNTITVDWMSNNSTGETVNDGTAIFELAIATQFNSNCTDIIINGNPMPSQVIQNVNGANINIGSQFTFGEVCVINPQGSVVDIAGLIFKENAQMVTNVDVTCTTVTPNFTTNSTGAYEFLNVQSSGTYTITPFKNDNPSNGLTGLDLALIQQHIVGLQPLNSPYKVIAADANNSGTITALDLVAIQNVITGSSSSFPNNNSWRFIPEDYNFPNPNNPLSPAFPEEIVLTNLTADSLTEHFIAIKVGDVNLTSSPSLIDNPSENLTFYIDNQGVNHDDEIIIDFKVNNFKDIMAWQMDLEFDTEQLTFLEINNVHLPRFNTNNIGQRFLNEGVLPIVWANPKGDKKGFTLEDEAIIFSIKFKVNNDIVFDENLFKIKTDRLTQAAYKKDESVNIELRYLNSSEQPKPKMWVGNNYPNPFGYITEIDFSLPVAETINFSISDISGRLVYTFSAEYDAGMNKIKLDETIFPQTGLYYYQLENSENRFNGKMIFTK